MLLKQTWDEERTTNGLNVAFPFTAASRAAYEMVRFFIREMCVGGCGHKE